MCENMCWARQKAVYQCTSVRGAGEEGGGDTCEVALGELVVGGVGDQQGEALGWGGRREMNTVPKFLQPMQDTEGT